MCKPQPVCSEGKYISGDTPTAEGVCVPQPTCGSSQYLDGGTKTTKGVCRNQLVCPWGQYLSGASSTTPGVCRRRTLCPKDEYLAGSSPTSDGTCKACSNVRCPDGEVRKGKCGRIFEKRDVNGYKCVKCQNTQCPAQEYRAGTCGGIMLPFVDKSKYDKQTGKLLEVCAGDCDTDAHCKPGLECFQRSGKARVPGCDAGGLKDRDYCYDPAATSSDGYSCKACDNTQCAAGEWRSDQCSGTSNGYKCNTQPTCSAGQFLSGATPTKAGKCSGCHDGQYLLTGQCTSCTTVANYACKDDVEYRSGSCAGEQASFTCNVCTNINCKPGEYRSGKCAEDTQGYVCTAQPTCSSDQYLANASSTQKGQCQLRPTCPNSQYIKLPEGSSTATSSGTCTTCMASPCPADHYTTGVCEGTVNTLACIPCKNTQCPADQYRSGECREYQNEYRCTTCTNVECGKIADWYRTGVCSGTTNGYECVAQPDCKNTEYLAGASSKQKGLCTSCPDSEYLVGGKCASCRSAPNFECTGVSNGTNQYRTGICAGSSSNYQCAQCDHVDCGPSQVAYRTGVCSGSTNGFVCVPQPGCSKGEFLSGATQTKPGVCSSCQDGSYSNERGVCTPCSGAPNSVCQQGQYRAGVCEASTLNFKCSNCDNLECPRGFYRSGSCSGEVNNFECKPHSGCSAENGERLVGATTTSPGHCALIPTTSTSSSSSTQTSTSTTTSLSDAADTTTTTTSTITTTLVVSTGAGVTSLPMDANEYGDVGSPRQIKEEMRAELVRAQKRLSKLEQELTFSLGADAEIKAAAQQAVTDAKQLVVLRQSAYDAYTAKHPGAGSKSTDVPPDSTTTNMSDADAAKQSGSGDKDNSTTAAIIAAVVVLAVLAGGIATVVYVRRRPSPNHGDDLARSKQVYTNPMYQNNEEHQQRNNASRSGTGNVIRLQAQANIFKAKAATKNAAPSFKETMVIEDQTQMYDELAHGTFLAGASWSYGAPLCSTVHSTVHP